MTTVEVLREARALIDTPEKWTKGDSYGCGFRVCAHGAIYAATNGFKADGSPRLRPDADEARDAFYALKSAIGANVYEFNDAPETTHADVLAAFDRAIEAPVKPYRDLDNYDELTERLAEDWATREYQRPSDFPSSSAFVRAMSPPVAATPPPPCRHETGDAELLPASPAVTP